MNYVSIILTLATYDCPEPIKEILIVCFSFENTYGIIFFLLYSNVYVNSEMILHSHMFIIQVVKNYVYNVSGMIEEVKTSIFFI